MLPFRSESNVIWLSVYTVVVLPVFVMYRYTLGLSVSLIAQLDCLCIVYLTGIGDF